MSSVDDDFRRAADRLRHQILASQVEQLDILDFAERYAAVDAWRDEAALLQLQVRHAVDGEADDELPGKLMSLLARIVEGHAAAGAQLLAEREEESLRLRDYVQYRTPAQKVVFKAEGLRKEFEGFTLGNIDLELRLGEVTGVVGQNAQGKTTLLRLIAGELKQSGGELSYPSLEQGPRRIDWYAVKRQMAFVPQELAAWGGSLRDTLHYEAALHGIQGRDNELAVQFIVERLALGDHLGKRWGELSGGYRLRFALARALVWKPQLLVLDEPLANLDVLAKSALIQDIRELARSYSHPIAVILSSHDLYNVEAVCSDVVFLRGGHADFAGAIGTIGERHATGEFELGTPLSLGELRQRLRGTQVQAVREDHLHAILVVPREVGAGAVLQLLLDRAIPIRYFRDNSSSLRRLFH